MFETFPIVLNGIAVVVGTIIGAIARKGIRRKYITVLNTAMGLCALVLGINVSMGYMAKSQMPVLFLFCMTFGGLIGTVLKFDKRMKSVTARLTIKKRHPDPDEVVEEEGERELSEGIITAVLLCCVGALSMMGPVLLALGDPNGYTFLMTSAGLNLVTMVIIASSYGFGVGVTAIAVLIWQFAFYIIAHVSADFISDEVVTEVSLVGGILIAAAGLGLMDIKDCKTINLLPALFLPMIFFAIKNMFGF